MPLEAPSVSPAARRLADDALPAARYNALRPKLRAEMLRRKERRRLRLGDHAALLFENYDTARYHLQEILRVEGDAPARRRRHAAEIATVVPVAGELRATLLIDSRCRLRGGRLAAAAGQRGGLRLSTYGGEVLSEPLDHEGSADEPVRFLRFAPSALARVAFADGVSIVSPADGIRYGMPPALLTELALDLLHARRPR